MDIAPNANAWSSIGNGAGQGGVGASTEGQLDNQSNLWLAAQSQTSLKRQREQELVDKEARDAQARLAAQEAERAELMEQRRKQQEEEETQKVEEQRRALEAEKSRLAMRAAAREKRENLEQSVDLDQQSLLMSSLESDLNNSGFDGFADKGGFE